MIEFDGTFILVVISFLVFAFLMKQVFFDPLFDIQQRREAKIAADQQQAKTFLQEEEQLRSRYQTRLIEARREAQRLILELSQKAKHATAETLAGARDEARRHLEAKLAELARLRDDAYRALEPERRTLADMLITKITAGKIPAGSKP